jgi:CelD/BcsL family acetyltransferase involved in cellulose biosynthesis
MKSLRIVNSLPNADWQRFVTENPHSSIFHTPEMFEVFARTKGYEPKIWAVVDQSGQPLALLLPVNISVMSGPLRPLTTRAVVFGSVLCQPGIQGMSALDLLLKTYTAEKLQAPIFTELRNLWDMQELLPVLAENHFVYEAHLDSLIDISDGPDAVFARIGARTRKNIRHGINRGSLQLEELTNPAKLGECYELLLKTYQKAHVPLADISLFKTAFDVLHTKGMIRFTMARVEDATVATSVELLHKDIVYGWYGGLNRAFSSYSPNEIMMWHILEWGAKNGYRCYDFGGAGKPDVEYGVRDFKAKFGGTQVSFGRNVYVHKPFLMGIAELGYNFVRRFF